MGRGYTGFYCAACDKEYEQDELRTQDSSGDSVCEECYPELFAKKPNPNSPQTTIKTYQDSKGKNVLTSKQQEFLMKLVSLCAEYEVVFWPDGFGGNGIKFFQICDAKMDREPFFKADACRLHDDVSDDYNLTGTDSSYSFDDIELRATRECCADMVTETTVVDTKLGEGYTTCKNCGSRRDWR